MSDKKFETAAIRHQIERSGHKEHSVPIYATSSFKFDDAEDARSLFAEALAPPLANSQIPI